MKGLNCPENCILCGGEDLYLEDIIDFEDDDEEVDIEEELED